MKNSSNMKTVALALAAFALVTVSIRGQAPPSYRQQQEQGVRTLDVVEARKFVLRDASGLVRLEIGPNRNGNAIGLRFFDRKGTNRLNLGVAEDGDTVAISLSDAKGEDRVVLIANPDSAAVATRMDREAGISNIRGGQAAFEVSTGDDVQAAFGLDGAGQPVLRPQR